MSEWEWHYLLTGTRTHARYRRSTGAGLDYEARCGAAPQYFSDWYGTGSQAEYERAEALPRCARCVKLGAK